jgi:hypothetical protein
MEGEEGEAVFVAIIDTEEIEFSPNGERKWQM